MFDVPEDHGTVCGIYIPFLPYRDPPAQSHTSIVDKNGMAVAITSTINLAFGSRVIDPVTGILFNDEVCDVDHTPVFTRRSFP